MNSDATPIETDAYPASVCRLNACITATRPDFAGAFMEMRDYAKTLTENPGLPPEVLDPADVILTEELFANHRICRILYTNIAECLVRLSEFDTPLGRHAWKRFRFHAGFGKAIVRGRVSLAACRFPLSFPAPAIPEPGTECRMLSPLPLPDGRWMGRSLVSEKATGIRVVKFLRKGGDARELASELLWQDLIGRQTELAHVPCPVFPESGILHRFAVTCEMVENGIDPQGRAIVFETSPAYFHYAVADDGTQPDAGTFLTVLRQTAFDLGHLAARGLFHTAVIPLFHNRVQGHRRDDEGRYLWHRMGRLDRWLGSCLHPNVGGTGLRDFEHISRMEQNGPELRLEMGNQLLSLVLLSCAWFRMQTPQRTGRNEDGSPVDARDLFDRDLLARLLREMVSAYAEGFGATPPEYPTESQARRMANRLVETAGVDTHMLEILRIRDQNALDEEGFRAYLAEHGLPMETPKGTADIVVESGPHLGGFNDRISVPELITFLEVATARLLSGRYARLRTLETKTA